MLDDNVVKEVVPIKRQEQKKYPLYLTSTQMGFFWAMIQLLPNKDDYPLSREGIVDIVDQITKYRNEWKA